MNCRQKRSWAVLAGMSLALILVIVAGLLHLLDVGWSYPFICAAAVAQATGGIVALRVRPDKGAVTTDERDKEIEKSANLAGFGAVYFYVIVVSFAPIAILGEDGMIPAKYMPGLLVGAGLCQVYAMSITTLLKYGRSDKADAEVAAE